jgi:hypothetical protein
MEMAVKRMVGPLIVLALTFYLLQAAQGHCNPVVALHLSSNVDDGDGCRAQTPPCSEFMTKGSRNGIPYWAYVLVAGADSAAGVRSVTFGICYESNVGVFSWNPCTGEPGKQAISSQKAFTVVWPKDSCQRAQPAGPGTGVIACAGYFYLSSYSGGRFSIAPPPGDHRVQVTDCAGRTTALTASDSTLFGIVDFGLTGLGYNPCR